MAIVQAMCTSFKRELLTATHNFTAGTGDLFKLALYLSTANLGADSTVYTTSGEVSSSGTNYPAGGASLTNITPSSSDTVGLTDFADVTFSNVTVSARGALIYNSSKANRAVVVLNFGEDKTVTAGTFTVAFPPPTKEDAIIRIA